jgi:hypothetical protein
MGKMRRIKLSGGYCQRLNKSLYALWRVSMMMERCSKKRSPWKSDPKEVDYNAVLFEHRCDSKNPGRKTLGREGLRKTKLYSIMRVLLILMN